MGPKISFKNEFPCIENRHTLIASILFGCDSFNFEEAKPDGLSKDLENRKQFELGDGRVYEGQWIIGTSIREGKGRPGALGLFSHRRRCALEMRVPFRWLESS